MRRAAALTMVVLAAVLFAAAAIAWYADDTLVDDQEFATRLTSSLDDGEVRGVVGDQIVDRVDEQRRARRANRAPAHRAARRRGRGGARVPSHGARRARVAPPRAGSGRHGVSACSCRWGRARSSRG